MRAEQVSLAQGRQHGEERLCRTHLLPKVFESVRQRMTNRKAKRAQTECIEKNAHLVPDPCGAVLQISIIKSQPGIQNDPFHSALAGSLDLARKKVVHR